jgi:hypothetical protein
MRLSLKGWTRGRLLGITGAYAFVVFLLVSAALNAGHRRATGSAGQDGRGSKFFQALGYGYEVVTPPPLVEVKRNATPPCPEMLRPAIVVLCFNR